jgi:hypothetical protein
MKKFIKILSYTIAGLWFAICIFLSLILPAGDPMGWLEIIIRASAALSLVVLIIGILSQK